MFKKILIANRGEIACRVISTARRMGIKTVAVYSEADKDARHVEMADEAVLIGPPPSAQSYLQIERIVKACKDTGAEAVHPGYGFLSENPRSAPRWRRKASSSSGRRLTRWRRWATRSRRRSSRWQPRSTRSPATTRRSPRRRKPSRSPAGIGYPVMIKASAGGGGKGLRVAYDDTQCREGLAACRNEAKNAFGDDRVFIEKFVEEPRHIEIQVLGDAHGNIVYLQRARMLDPASPPESHRRGALAFHRRSDAQGDGRAGGAARPRGQVPVRRDGRVRRRQGQVVLLPGDEHPAAGRAPGHRVRSRGSTWSS